LLLISLLTLFAGPLILLWISRGGRMAQALDRLIVLLLVLLVFLLLLPDIVAAMGWSALLLVALGYLLPGILETVVRRAAATLHLASVGLALLGLLLHASLDGAGLAGSELQATPGLAMAIVLHRFSVGTMIWLIMQPAFGQRPAWLMLAAMAAATVAGFEFSSHLLPLAGKFAVAVLQALVIGTIVHSLLHRGHAHIHARTQHGH
jgi:hypothetical protein